MEVGSKLRPKIRAHNRDRGIPRKTGPTKENRETGTETAVETVTTAKTGTTATTVTTLTTLSTAGTAKTVTTATTVRQQ